MKRLKNKTILSRLSSKEPMITMGNNGLSDKLILYIDSKLNNNVDIDMQLMFAYTIRQQIK